MSYVTDRLAQLRAPEQPPKNTNPRDELCGNISPDEQKYLPSMARGSFEEAA